MCAHVVVLVRSLLLFLFSHKTILVFFGRWTCMNGVQRTARVTLHHIVIWTDCRRKKRTGRPSQRKRHAARERDGANDQVKDEADEGNEEWNSEVRVSRVKSQPKVKWMASGAFSVRVCNWECASVFVCARWSSRCCRKHKSQLRESCAHKNRFSHCAAAVAAHCEFVCVFFFYFCCCSAGWLVLPLLLSALSPLPFQSEPRTSERGIFSIERKEAKRKKSSEKEDNRPRGFDSVRVCLRVIVCVCVRVCVSV